MSMATGYTYQYGWPLGRGPERSFSVPRVRRLGFNCYETNNRAGARKVKGVKLWQIK